MQSINSVFLIDDERMFNLINQKILQITNFDDNVYCYADASIALNDLKQIIDSTPINFPGIIFLDINMPGMNGWEFLEEFNKFDIEIKNKCKVYMLTSSINPVDLSKSNNNNVIHGFIPKPLSIEKLADFGTHSLKL